MRYRTCAVAVVLFALLATHPARAAQPAVKHDPNLEAIDWLAHGIWTAELKTPEGKPLLIQNEIRWAETGTAIYFLTRFNHEAHYYGVYAYDPAEKQIKFFYSSRDGEMTQGMGLPNEKGLRQDFQISSAQGVQKLWSTIVRSGDNDYDFTVYPQGSETAILRVHYVRKQDMPR